MIVGSVFCEVLHSEATRRKRNGMASRCGIIFLEGVSSLLVEKKVKQRPVPYTHQDVTFRRCFTAFDEKKGVQEPMPFTGENVSALSCLHGKLTSHGYL